MPTIEEVKAEIKKDLENRIKNLENGLQELRASQNNLVRDVDREIGKLWKAWKEKS